MAKTDWELAISNSGFRPRPSLWRLTAGVISIVALSAGVGFYLPLQREEQLLATEYQRTKTLASALEQRLAENERALAAVGGERTVLAEAKQKIDAAQETRHQALNQVLSSLSQKLQHALDRQRIKLTETSEHLQLDLLDPALFTTNHDAVSGTGQKLLCTFASEVKRAGRYRVVVHTFADAAASVSPAESRFASPALHAASVAQVLTARCGLATDLVEIAAGTVTGEPPVPRLDVYPPSVL